MKSTRKKKVTAEVILKEAFKLFVVNEYEKVTTVDLERATGVSRGAIFYQFRSKEELYKSVVEFYIIGLNRLEFEKRYADIIMPLKDFIRHYVGVIKSIDKMAKDMDIENIKGHYYSFIFQSIKRDPDLARRILDIFNEEHDRWEHIIQHAYDNKEIRQDVNVRYLANTFRYLHLGMAVEKGYDGGLKPKGLGALYENLYALVKADKTEK